MYFSLAIASVISLVSKASAMPSPWASKYSAHLHLSARGLPGAVYICTGSNFSGNCGWITPSLDCHLLGTGSTAPGSIGPDSGGACVFYPDTECKGMPIETLRFPGSSDLPKSAQSLKCSADSSVTASKEVSQKASLAGGEGSTKKEVLDKQLGGNINTKEGLIGLEKDVYY